MPVVFLLVFCLLAFLVLLLLIAGYLWLAYQRGRWPFDEGSNPRYPAREFFARNQVVLSGSKAQVDSALSVARGVRLTRVERLDFSELPLPEGCPVPDDFVVDLYRIEGWLPRVQQAVRALKRTPAGQAGEVEAEPNWVTGHPWEPEGSPWEPEGSPWEPEGSPWEPEGSAPSGAPRRRPSIVEAQPEWFATQWAWQSIGLENRLKSVDGTGIAVGIFDTSPYAFPPDTRGYHQDVPFVTWPAPMQCTVSHPRFAAPPAPASHPLPDVRNHGLFIAGLIHAVAPGADLHLVRVLNSHNRGDLFTLLREVFLFLKAHAGGQGMVLNLSLGIRVPPPEAGFDLPAEVKALHYLTVAARCLGSVVVAAAGNESSPQAALPGNLPAQWAHVLGVAGSTQDDRRACFSNRGDIAAPGGDGSRQAVRLAANAHAEQCRPALSGCDSPACGFALIGPVLDGSTHYVFWSGTSFAAPLVSGLAALTFQAGKGAYTPQQVEDLIRCGARPTEDTALGAGVISVGDTLRRCRRQMSKKAQEV